MRSLTFPVLVALALGACTDKDTDTDTGSEVVDAEFTGIAVAPNNMTLTVGATEQLVVTAQFSDGSSSDVTTAAEYRVINASVAEVSANGLVTGLANGTTDLEITYQGESDEISISVGAPSINGEVHFLGFPVVGATVTLTGDEADDTTTDDDGSFSFPHLGVGDYTVTATFPGSDRRVDPSRSVSISSGDVDGVVLDIESGGEPTGPDAWENDSLPGTAQDLAIGTVQHRTLWASPSTTVDGGDVDFVRVAVQAGATYEFFTAGLNVTGDTIMTVFAADGITPLEDEGLELADSDDFIGFESRVVYSPSEAGEVVLRIEHFESELGVADYFVGAVASVDLDRDGVPAYRDCDDNDADVSPSEPEVLGDGTDNDCFDGDQPSTDANEPNDTRAAATALRFGQADLYARTLDAGRAHYGVIGSDDVDMFSVVVPAKSKVDLYFDGSGSLDVTTLANDGTTEAPLTNAGTSSETRYISVTGEADSSYTIMAVDMGADTDGDGFYPGDFGDDRDCAEGDASRGPEQCAD